MKIVVCGLGYVGVTAAACLARDGHKVVGVDVDRRKVGAVSGGQSPVSEPGVADLVARTHAAGKLSAGIAVKPFIKETDVVVVCVGTPSAANGALELGHIRNVTREIGAAIASLPENAPPPLVVYRSTVPPGTMEGVVIPALTEATQAAPGTRYDVAFNPEFMRESTAIADYDAPPKIVIGEREPGVTRRLHGLYGGIDAPVFEMSFAEAELVKLTDNAFHALKVAFGNEVGRIGLTVGADPQHVMEAFLVDAKLNISPAYLRPGGAFGGSCLPKDVRAVAALAAGYGVEVPLISAALTSNTAHKAYLTARVMEAAPTVGSTILLLGLSFKSHSDDMRESPLVDLAETLLGKGYDVCIIDPDLEEQNLIGANLRYIEAHLPHLSRLLVTDLEEVGTPALVVRGKAVPQVEAQLDPSWPVIDLVRL